MDSREIQAFDYLSLDATTARQLRVSTKRIQYLAKRSLGDVIDIGHELIGVKDTLPHGQFLSWLDAEFGWQERTARNFIAVANRFKSATVADLEIDLSAAYLLSAPSIPEAARQNAVARATQGERISRAVAREIIADYQGAGASSEAPPGATSMKDEVLKKLESLKKRFPHHSTREVARLLREIADSLDRP